MELIEFDPSNEETLSAMITMPELYEKPLIKLIQQLWGGRHSWFEFEYEDEFMMLRGK